MKILLKSNSDILGWASMFRILGFDLSVPIWEMIGIPKEIVINPKYVVQVAERFFMGNGEITPKGKMTSEKEVSNYFEARRMIDLGCLYNCFGRIVAYYNEENAINLYYWGERNFIQEKSSCWYVWHSIFLNMLRTRIEVKNYFDKQVFEKTFDTIKDEFEKTAFKKKKLETEFRVLCQKYALNLEKQNSLKNLMYYDYTDQNNFNDIHEELTSVFNFDLLLNQDCAFRIWRVMNIRYDKNFRKKMFGWGVNVYHSLGGTLDKSLEEYCLSV